MEENLAAQLGPPSVAQNNLEDGDGEELSHSEPAAVFTLPGAIGEDEDGDGEECSHLQPAAVFTLQGAVWMIEAGGRDSKGRLDAHVLCRLVDQFHGWIGSVLSWGGNEWEH